MRRYLDLGVFEVLLVHNRWTLVDRSAGPLLDRAAELGVGVVNAAVLGGGILADESGRKTDYGYRPASQETLEAISRMRDVCRRWDTTLAAAALRFSTRDERFASTIVGISKPHASSRPSTPRRSTGRTSSGTNSNRSSPPPTNWLDAATDTPTTDHRPSPKAEAPCHSSESTCTPRSPTCARR